MASYLALYMGSAANEQRPEPDEATQQKGMAAWGVWTAEHQAAIVDQGAPLGKTLKVDQGGTSATSNLIAGYVVVEAVHTNMRRRYSRTIRISQSSLAPIR